jgi:hypothetical protein
VGLRKWWMERRNSYVHSVWEFQEPGKAAYFAVSSAAPRMPGSLPATPDRGLLGQLARSLCQLSVCKGRLGARR